MKAEPASVVVIGPPLPDDLAPGLAATRALVRHFDSAAHALRGWPSRAIDVVVVVHDAGFDALPGLVALRAEVAHADRPILVVDPRRAVADRRSLLRAGATDILAGPFDAIDFENRLAILAELARARRALAARESEGERRAPGIRPEAHEREIIRRLLRAAETRDKASGAHVRRVAAFAIAIAEALGLSVAQADDIALASTMHDIGKIAVPDAILNKPDALTPSERDAMQAHTREGFHLLDGSSSHLVRLASEIALTHHEHWDGSGYPQGLSGEAIPLSGRIVAVADVFDALTSARVYKSGWTLARAREHLEAHAGSHFDPACVAAFLSRWADVAAVVEDAPSETAAA